MPVYYSFCVLSNERDGSLCVVALDHRHVSLRVVKLDHRHTTLRAVLRNQQRHVTLRVVLPDQQRHVTLRVVLPEQPGNTCSQSQSTGDAWRQAAAASRVLLLCTIV